MAAYTIVRIHQKGLEMLANRVIDPGEEIIRETPLIKMEIGLHELYNQDTFWQARLPHNGVEAVERAVAALDRNARNQFENLHNALPGDGEIIGRILTNVFAEDVERNGHIYKELVLYSQLSRVNHSCRPNAEHHWNPETLTGSLHALRQIATGEEIVVNYLGHDDSLDVQRERRKNLKNAFGFDCSCDACILRGRELTDDNELRGKAGRLHRSLENSNESQRNMDKQRMMKLGQATEYIACLLQLNIKDGRLAWGYSKLAEIHIELYTTSARLPTHASDCACRQNGHGAGWHLQRAVGALTRMCGLDAFTHGRDHPRVRQDRDEITNLSMEMILEL